MSISEASAIRALRPNPRPAQQWTPLLRLHIVHRYGASAQQGLRFQASAATQALLERYGLLLQGDAQDLALYADERALQALWDEQRQQGLDFLLSWRLLAPPLWSLTASDAPHYLLMPLGRRSASDTEFGAWRAALPAQERLEVQPRELSWKYLLVGDWSGLCASGQIEDIGLALQDGEHPALRFVRDEAKERLADGREAWVYRSPRPLPLAEHSRRRVSLRDHSLDPPRVLLDALPHGAPRGLQRDQGIAGSPWVAEIFLIR